MLALKLLLFICCLTLTSCATTPPKQLNNACAIFNEKSDWYQAAYNSYKRWGVPINVLLAIMHQESKFIHDAKPPRQKLLWVIPWTRPSSAYGYAQVKDDTWDWYREKTGHTFADRDDFDDAIDFIGWYGTMSKKLAGVPLWNAREQYLAYHEGHGGYKRKTYRKKKWLMQVADKVARNSWAYKKQLEKCEDDLDRGWSLWPF